MIKAMILAAGRGERMRPLTNHCPKPLLTVQGQALIEYHLYKLQASGIKNVVINTAWLGTQIQNFLGNGNRYQLVIHYSPETQALETAGGIINALPLLHSDQPWFLVVNGDIFTDYDFTPLINHPLQTLAHLVMVSNPSHHPQGDFYLHQGLLSEHPPGQPGGNLSDAQSAYDTYTYSGIGLYHEDFFKGLSVSKQPLAPLLKQHIRQQQVSAEYYPGHWSDVGTPQRLDELNQR